MADEQRILYFIEDVAHESFMRALVERVAHEESWPADLIQHEFHYATRGRGYRRRLSSGGFRNFLNDTRKISLSDFALLVVVFDGNCMGHNERKSQLERNIKQNHPFKNRTIFAIPNPHIERWYIMDQRAFREATGIEDVPQLPEYKCLKDYYKRIVHQTLRKGGINSLLAGAEYAEKIVERMQDLYALGKSEAGFGDFVADLRRRLKQIRSFNI